MARKLIDYLPPDLKKMQVLNVILNELEQPQYDALQIAINHAYDDQYIQDATENGISRREKPLNIIPKATDTLDQRRERLLARENEDLPFSYRNLKQMLDALCGEDNYILILYLGISTVYVKVNIRDEFKIEEIRSMLERVVPGNLFLDLRIKYNTHQYVSGFTHAELKRYTHWQIRNETLQKAEIDTAVDEGYTYEELEAFTYEELEAFSNEALEGS